MKTTERKTEHTPGPWTISKPANRSVAIYGRGPIVSGVIATVDCAWCHEDQRAEQRANTRLIAAAPELLAALQKALETSWREGQPQRTWHEQARAAIAKVEGPDL